MQAVKLDSVRFSLRMEDIGFGRNRIFTLLKVIFLEKESTVSSGKKLAGNLQRSRIAKLIVEGTAKEVLETNINRFKCKTVVFEISKVVIKLEDGTFVGEYPLQVPSGEGNEATSFNNGSGQPSRMQSTAASPKVDPVGEWTTRGVAKKLSLCLWESGEARGEFEENGVSC